MTIGIALGVSEAIVSTNAHEVQQIIIWQHFQTFRIRHRIECEVWEYSGGDYDTNIDLGCCPADLSLHGGRCHTFQYRKEEMLNPNDPDDVDLLENDENTCPSGLLPSVPKGLRAGAARSVSNWLETIYPALISGEDA